MNMIEAKTMIPISEQSLYFNLQPVLEKDQGQELYSLGINRRVSVTVIKEKKTYSYQFLNTKNEQITRV